LQLQQWRC